MRIATFNANSIRSRQGIVLAWLAQQKPDILCVQETKAQDKDFPAAAFADSGYHVVFKGEKTYNGVAIFSRAAPEAVRHGFDDGGPADESRLIHARIGGIDVVNTYVPQGRELDHEMYAYKVEWFRRLKKHFARHCSPDKPVVWTGDLNVALEPIDVYEPENHEQHVCYHTDVRRALADCCAWGFADVFRLHHAGEPKQYTFFDYRLPNPIRRGLGWRLDYIMATRPLAAACTGSFIDLEPRRADKPSDHTFLAADFDWRA